MPRHALTLEIPTLESLGGAKNTVGAGLPVFAGRLPGDLHYETAGKVPYVLTGAASLSVTDALNRADGALVGSTTDTGGKTWAADNVPASFPSAVIAGGQIKRAAGQTQGVAYIDTGSGGGHKSMTADLTMPNDTNGHHLGLHWASTNLGAQGVYAFLSRFTAVVRYVDSGGVSTVLGTYNYPTALNPGEVETYTFDYDTGSGAWALVRAGITLISGTDVAHASALTTFTKAHILVVDTDVANLGALDNFQLENAGTLAWTAVASAAALNFKGVWSAISAYAPNDLVLRDSLAWVANGAIPAGTDPAAAPTATTLASSLSAAASVFNGGTNIVSQEITIGASPCNGVDTVTIRFNAQPGATGSVRLGLASAFTETTGIASGAVPWLTTSTGAPAYIEIPCSAIAAGQDVVITLPGTVSLAASTAYNLVAVNVASNTGSNAGVNAIGVGSANVLTNVTNQNEIFGISTGTGGVNQVNSSNGSGFTWIYRIQSSGSPWRALTSPTEQVNTVAASGAAVTLPDVIVASMHRVTLTANTAITLPTPGAGKSFTVALVQDATGGRTVSWTTPSGAIKWPGGTAPTITATANKIDVISFACLDATNWLAFVSGQNL